MHCTGSVIPTLPVEGEPPRSESKVIDVLGVGMGMGMGMRVGVGVSTLGSVSIESTQPHDAARLTWAVATTPLCADPASPSRTVC